MKNLIVFVSAMSTLLFSSCAKKIQPMPGVPGNCRVDMVKAPHSHQNNLFYYYYYKFNFNHGQVASIEAVDSLGNLFDNTYIHRHFNSKGNVILEYYVYDKIYKYEYDTQNNLIKAIQYSVYDSNFEWPLNTFYYYRINQKIDSIIKIDNNLKSDTIRLYYDLNNTRPSRIQLNEFNSYRFYDQYNNLVKDSMTYNSDSENVNHVNEYTFDYEHLYNKDLAWYFMKDLSQNSIPSLLVASTFVGVGPLKEIATEEIPYIDPTPNHNWKTNSTNIFDYRGQLVQYDGNSTVKYLCE